MSLQILVVSDIHGREDFLPRALSLVRETNARLLIVCGDITQFGKPKGWAKIFIDSLPVKVLAIPGNCDPPEEFMKDLEKSRGTNLHGKTMEIDGVTFVGFGGAKLSVHNLPFEMPDEVIYESLDRIMVSKAVLVTHAPPTGHLDRVDSETSLGSDAIAQIVEKYKPVLLLSGHVHEARGIERDKGTVFVNPGPAKNGCAAFVDIGDDGKIEASLL